MPYRHRYPRLKFRKKRRLSLDSILYNYARRFGLTLLDTPYAKSFARPNPNYHETVGLASDQIRKAHDTVVNLMRQQAHTD